MSHRRSTNPARSPRGLSLVESLMTMAIIAIATGATLPGFKQALERIQEKLLASGAREVPSTRLGELVMRELKRIDKVAYVRFASVYREFEDVDAFRQLIRDI